MKIKGQTLFGFIGHFVHARQKSFNIKVTYVKYLECYVMQAYKYIHLVNCDSGRHSLIQFKSSGPWTLTFTIAFVGHHTEYLDIFKSHIQIRNAFRTRTS